MSAAGDLLDLGNRLAQRGELQQAAASFRNALAVNPEWPEALSNLGNALREMGQPGEAAVCLERALERRPEFPEALLNLAVVREEQGALEDAADRLRLAIRLRPQMAYAHNNLASVLQKQGRTGEALEHLREALRLDPDFAEAHHNLGVVLDGMGRPGEAIASYREALRRKADYADAHLDLGLALLRSGDFTAGWEEYEWRWRTRRARVRRFVQPEWDGSPLEGRTLLIHAEQGLGDTVQFLRYVPLVPDAAILLEVPPAAAPLVGQTPWSARVPPRALHPLAARAPAADGGSAAPAAGSRFAGVAGIVPAGAALPPFDRHIPLLSLPRLFQTTLRTIPRATPYLPAAYPARIAFWNRRMGHEGTFRIGLCWAGSGAHSNNRTRSMRLADCAPLAAIPGISFFSLQKGPPSREPPPDGMEIVDVLEGTADLRDTAAVIQNLDLVLSVDTLVAHLAGALARAVWTLLPFAADWRWLRQREDCPWYPTMRLVRQPGAGDWKSVIERVAGCLEAAHLEKSRLCPPLKLKP